MNNPRYRFYQGRWWSKEQWESLKTRVALASAVESLLYPEFHKKQAERTKFLAENADVMLSKEQSNE